MTQEVDLRPERLALGGDYTQAVVHLAWNREDKTRTLLFGCVELLPNEVPPSIDDYDPKGGLRLGSGSKHHVHIRHVVVSADEALRWYERCRQGSALRPSNAGKFDDESSTFVLAELAEEPRWPELLCDAEPEFPFIAPWHLSPRLHHLVPSESAVPDFWTDTERDRAIDYLAVELPLDLRHFRELWGSVHLVAPNPIHRTLRTTRETVVEGGECVLIELVPRAGVAISNLRMLVREDRPTGTFALHTFDVAERTLHLQFGHEVERVSVSLVDEQRGLLYAGHAHNFLRQTELRLGLVSATREVVVPAKRKRKEDRYSVGVMRDQEVSLMDPKYVPGVATSRLLEGHFRREAYNLGVQLDQTWFDNEPDTAAQRIRELIKPACRCVLVVDGYFTALEFRRFALAASDASVRIEILTSAEGMREIARRAGTAQGAPATRAREMAGELAHALAAAHSNPTEVRVMEGRPAIHDRFLLVDDRLWSLGASLNELGSRGSLMLRVPDPEPIVTKLRAAWDEAPNLAEWIAGGCEPATNEGAS